jgi:CBS domain containing-hemolysin-like protein
MSSIVFLISLIFLYLLLFIFCGFETGMLSIDRLKLEQDAKKSNYKKRILSFYDNNDKTLGTVLIGTNLSTVAIATISTLLFCERFQFSETIVTCLTTIVILIFCEIIPKNLFREFPNRLVDFFFPLINFFFFLFKPFFKVVSILNIKIKKKTKNRSVL